MKYLDDRNEYRFQKNPHVARFIGLCQPCKESNVITYVTRDAVPSKGYYVCHDCKVNKQREAERASAEARNERRREKARLQKEEWFREHNEYAKSSA